MLLEVLSLFCHIKMPENGIIKKEEMASYERRLNATTSCLIDRRWGFGIHFMLFCFFAF